MCISKIPGRALVFWMALAVPVTFLSLLVYVAVQQNFRQNANDPQIQMTEDAAAVLAGGKDPRQVVPAEKVEISESLAPFLIVVDPNGDSLASSGELDGRTPHIPAGVLRYARENGENRVTWQPRSGVRIALVVRPFDGSQRGFAAAGRSLREVEVREGQLSTEVFAGWIAALCGAAITCFAASAALSVLNRRE